MLETNPLAGSWMGRMTVSAGETETVWDAAIIGAGHNGLTAAAYLARAGRTVLVLERRAIVGGACATEEIAPGARVSSCAYIASMLLPRIVEDLDLAVEGLRMVPCDPAITLPLGEGRVLRWWSDPARTAAEIAAFSTRDADAFLAVDSELKALARYLQPFFLEPPPDMADEGFARLGAAWRLARRFLGISGAQTAALLEFVTGSLGDFLDRRFESDEVKRLFLANNVYGKHGGPYDQGSAIGLLFHLLAGGETGVQGFSGHVIGGMGAISQALAQAAARFGAKIRTEAPVAEIIIEGGRAVGVVLEDGARIRARRVLSNADPKRTFLKLTPAFALDKAFRRRIAGIKMAGPSGKLNLMLKRAPTFTWRTEHMSAAERAVFTHAPLTLAEAQRCYAQCVAGEIPDRLWIDCVIPSLVDASLAPAGVCMMTCFLQYLPYDLRGGDWDGRREALGDQAVRELSAYLPDLAEIIAARSVLTPLDLERTYGLTEGNIFHGDLRLNQLFFMRPAPGCSQYTTPIPGLYLCGAGAHPGGGVTGAPGHNCAMAVLKEKP